MGLPRHNYLIISIQIRKPVADEQFGKFVEVIEKLYVNIPLLDAMQVPTYAKYIKDILGNKRKPTHHRGRATHRGV